MEDDFFFCVCARGRRAGYVSVRATLLKVFIDTLARASGLFGLYVMIRARDFIYEVGLIVVYTLAYKFS